MANAELSEGPKALVKGLLILQEIAEHRDGLSLADINRLTAIPKPTVLRLVQPLLDHRLLQLDAEGNYRLGAQCLVLGTSFIEGVDLRAEALDVLADLVSHAGETCHLGVLDGVRVVYIEKVESSHAVRMHSQIGRTNPAYCTGLGKAMLSHAPDDTVEQVIAAGLEPRTPQTITDAAVLRTDLRAARERGFAIDDVENEEGIRCVASPVLDARGRVVAGISIAGPTYRVTQDRLDELGARVQTGAHELSKRIGYLGEFPITHAIVSEGHDDEES